MKKPKVKNKNKIQFFTAILPVFIFTAVISVVLLGLSDTSGSVESEGLRVAQEAIARAAVSCYAIEGSYPDTYEYLRDNYGLSVNEERYIVHYQVFAANIMPDITVIPRGGVA